MIHFKQSSLLDVVPRPPCSPFLFKYPQDMLDPCYNAALCSSSLLLSLLPTVCNFNFNVRCPQSPTAHTPDRRAPGKTLRLLVGPVAVPAVAAAVLAARPHRPPLPLAPAAAAQQPPCDCSVVSAGDTRREKRARRQD